MALPPFKGKRLTPYKNFRFLVSIVADGSARPVAGVSKVSPLKRTTTPVTHRDGGDPHEHVSPGQTKFEPITLERGVTHDLEFDDWAHKVNNARASLGSLVSLGDFRRDLRIELLNEAGQTVVAYNVFNCWVSDYTAMPELDASGNAVAIQSMVIQNEGWERDLAIKEPKEPTYGIPR